MKAIRTRFAGVTNTKPSRIIATDYDGNSFTLSYPHELTSDDAHRKAAESLLAKMGWNNEIVGGGWGSDYVWVMLPKGQTVASAETPAAVPDICVPPTISEVIAQYPARFHLRWSAIPFGSPFDTFRIDPVASYRNDAGDVQLVLERNVTGMWLHFGKVYPAELDDNIMKRGE